MNISYHETKGWYENKNISPEPFAACHIGKSYTKMHIQAYHVEIGCSNPDTSLEKSQLRILGVEFHDKCGPEPSDFCVALEVEISRHLADN